MPYNSDDTSNRHRACRPPSLCESSALFSIAAAAAASAKARNNIDRFKVRAQTRATTVRNTDARAKSDAKENKRKITDARAQKKMFFFTDARARDPAHDRR